MGDDAVSPEVEAGYLRLRALAALLKENAAVRAVLFTQRREVFMRLLGAGVKQGEIGKAANISPQAVVFAVSKGVKAEAPPAPDTGDVWADLATVVSEVAAAGAAKKAMLAERTAVYLALLAAGEQQERIAQAAGVSSMAVQFAVKGPQKRKRKGPAVAADAP